MDIASQHQSAQERFLEIATLRDIHEQAAMSVTAWGRLLLLSTWLFTAVGTVRLINCLIHVAGYFLWQGRPLLNAQQIAEQQKAYGRFGATDSFMVVPMLLSSLSLDEKTWSAAATFTLAIILGLMQVRAFFIVTTQLAKLGFISTSSEIYSLLLAHISGAYFVACVIFLRAQLGPEHRKGITKALGHHLNFSFYGFLFDCVFVVSCFLTVFLEYLDYNHKLSSFQHNSGDIETSASTLNSHDTETSGENLV